MAWRIAVDSYDSEEEWEEAFARFLAAVDTTQVRALIVGLVERCVRQRSGARSSRRCSPPASGCRGCARCSSATSPSRSARSPGSTRAMSRPLLDGFPELLEFGVRGGQGLVFPAVRHEQPARRSPSRPAGCPPRWCAAVGGERTARAGAPGPVARHRPGTAATPRSPTWSRSSPAPGCRRLTLSRPCATARSQDEIAAARRRRPGRRPPRRRSTSRWAPSATRAPRPCSTASRSPTSRSSTCTTTSSASRWPSACAGRLGRPASTVDLVRRAEPGGRRRGRLPSPRWRE